MIFIKDLNNKDNGKRDTKNFIKMYPQIKSLIVGRIHVAIIIQIKKNSNKIHLIHMMT